MKTRILIVVAAVLALAAFRPPWGHRGLGHMNPERMERMANERVNDVLDDLDATPAQRTRVHAMKDDLMVDGRKFHEGNKAARAELITQWDSPRMDNVRAHALVDERLDAARAMAHKLVDDMLELHTLLTPEQRAKVSEHVRERTRD